MLSSLPWVEGQEVSVALLFLHEEIFHASSMAPKDKDELSPETHQVPRLALGLEGEGEFLRPSECELCL